jgi:hypothetical protein
MFIWFAFVFGRSDACGVGQFSVSICVRRSRPPSPCLPVPLQSAAAGVAVGHIDAFTFRF